MPIYMDRHDVSEAVSAENVAQLHQEDLKVQHHFDCRGLTYWFDEKRKTAFCLIEAPDEGAIRKMHKEAHGEVPHSVIEVDPIIVEAFLGRIEDPVKVQDTALNIINDPGFRTIMVIMIHPSPGKKADPATSGSSLNDHHNKILSVLSIHEGTPVKQTENYFLISFRSVSNAVRAAGEIRSLFREFLNAGNKNAAGLKIGLNAGLPVTEKRSIFEDTIRLAERMCRHLKGEMIISSEVKELYNSENPQPLKEGKGICSLTPADEQFLTLLMDHTESVWSDTDFKVDDLSKPVGYSKSQLYRKIISLTGKSPNTFIREYRLDAALNLLNRKTGNISDIAFQTGFSSPSYFSKCFQKRYGHSPSDHLSAKTINDPDPVTHPA